ncbi:MAG: transcription antitermination factor NusB [Deltaproteobacteria bacterium]|nr:transcription antitermination factor NusB [Deltaproteobacteria bacterium]MBI5811049.1 transcription antitermination factor NusB [Deltaproteobacteria bacterium]
MNERHKEREKALQRLYNADISDNMPDAGELKGYGLTLIEGVLERKGEIDSQIEASSDNWTIGRMPVVDRNILRIAVYELRYCTDIPYKVAIDEAVELAKRYGGEGSGAFVNGILDKVHKGLAEIP